VACSGQGLEVILGLEKNTQSLLQKLRGRRVLVVGDLVLDHYLNGKVSRISPEAPVPVVTLGDNCENSIPGGAANVALNVLSLGGEPVMAGVTGSDSDGESIRELLSEAGVNIDAVVSDPGRPTTVKTRVMGRSQQLLRIDREKTHLLSPAVETELKSGIDQIMDTVSAVIIEDYDKGVLTPELVKHIVNSSIQRKLYLAVDPKIRNFWSYSSCSMFKPNRHEAGFALGVNIDSVGKAIDAAVEIRSRLSAEAVLITLGSNGSVLVQGNGREPRHLRAVTRNVFDVSGAGDSVIAVIGLAGSCGIDTVDAATLANFAAAAVCREPGVYAVSPDDILREAGRFE